MLSSATLRPQLMPKAAILGIVVYRVAGIETINLADPNNLAVLTTNAYH
jgi:hypothetical protein